MIHHYFREALVIPDVCVGELSRLNNHVVVINNTFILPADL